MEVSQTLILLLNIVFLVGAYMGIKAWMAGKNRSLKGVIAAQELIGTASSDLDDTLQISVDQLIKVTKATGAVVELTEGDEIFYRAVSGALVDYKGLRMKFVNTLSGHCLAYKEIINCPDTEKDNRVNHEATRKLNIRSMIVAPLIHDDEAIGVLKVSSDRTNAFGKKEVQTVELLSQLIGQAIAQKQDDEVKVDIIPDILPQTQEARHKNY